MDKRTELIETIIKSIDELEELGFLIECEIGDEFSSECGFFDEIIIDDDEIELIFRS